MRIKVRNAGVQKSIDVALSNPIATMNEAMINVLYILDGYIEGLRFHRENPKANIEGLETVALIKSLRDVELPEYHPLNTFIHEYNTETKGLSDEETEAWQIANLERARIDRDTLLERIKAYNAEGEVTGGDNPMLKMLKEIAELRENKQKVEEESGSMTELMDRLKSVTDESRRNVKVVSSLDEALAAIKESIEGGKEGGSSIFVKGDNVSTTDEGDKVGNDGC